MSTTRSTFTGWHMQVARFILAPVGLLFIVMVTPSGIDGQSLLGRLIASSSSEIATEMEPQSSTASNRQNLMLSMTADNGKATEVEGAASNEIRVADDWLQKAGLPKMGE